MSSGTRSHYVPHSISDLPTEGEEWGVPGLVAEEDEDLANMRMALEAVLESAVEADVRKASVVREAQQEVEHGE
jgi:hypothetical protein